MSTYSITRNKEATVSTLITFNWIYDLWDRYMSYADSHENERIYWYLKVLLIFPGTIMVPTIFAMATMTSHFIWYVVLSMILFFANVMVYIAETKGRIFVPLYQVSIAILILIPIITKLILL